MKHIHIYQLNWKLNVSIPLQKSTHFEKVMKTRFSDIALNMQWSKIHLFAYSNSSKTCHLFCASSADMKLMHYLLDNPLTRVLVLNFLKYMASSADNTTSSTACEMYVSFHRYNNMSSSESMSIMTRTITTKFNKCHQSTLYLKRDGHMLKKEILCCLNTNQNMAFYPQSIYLYNTIDSWKSMPSISKGQALDCIWQANLYTIHML